MPEYTLTPIPDMVLYVDGVPAIVPASNVGAAVLNDFYHYLLKPSTGNHLKDATGWRDVVEAELL